MPWKPSEVPKSSLLGKERVLLGQSPVLVLGGIVLFLQTSAQLWIKTGRPWVQGFYLILSAAFYAYAIRRVNWLMLAFTLHFPACELLRSTRSIAPFVHKVLYALFTSPCLTATLCYYTYYYHTYSGDADATDAVWTWSYASDARRYITRSAAEIAY